MQDAAFSSQLTAFFERLSQAFALRHAPDPETPLLEVDEAVRSIAGFYEKTRNTLEYGEGDFLRQRAIVRTLRRSANFGATRGSDEQATEILRELIRAGYFPNEAIPETVAGPVGAALNRLFRALSDVNPLFHDELFRFAAFEIEEAIFPERAAAQSAIVSFVLEVGENRFRWPREALSDPAHRAFLFVAAYRAVLHADRSRILYAFVKDAFSSWMKADGEDIANLTKDFEQVLSTAKRTVAHPRTEQYARALRRMAPALRALDDAASRIVAEGADQHVTLFQLERRLEEVVAERCQEVKKKLRVAAWRATLYVFFTKMLVGLAIELPYELFILGSVVFEPFLINLIFPPALMFFVAFSARPPRPSVAERIVDDALRIAVPGKTISHVRLPRRRGGVRLAAFMMSVALLGGVALYFILKALSVLGFTPVSMAVFLVFLSIVSLFSWRVRRPLRDLAVSGAGRGVLGAAIEVVIFPFLAVGRTLSDGLRSVNIFVFLLDVFIESPLKVMFAGIEDWLAFLREKRERLVEE